MIFDSVEMLTEVLSINNKTWKQPISLRGGGKKGDLGNLHDMRLTDYNDIKSIIDFKKYLAA